MAIKSAERPVRQRVEEAPVGECRTCDAHRGQMHPSHESPTPGHRDHCACSGCF